MKGEDLAIVLRTSWADPIVKEKFFTTPLCWEVIDTAKRRSDSQQEYPPKAPRTGSCDNGKGQGKGKGKESEAEGCAECRREMYLLCLQQPESEVYDEEQIADSCMYVGAVGAVRWRSCQCTSVLQLLLPHTESGRGPRQDLHPRLTQLKEVVQKKQANKRMKRWSLLPKVLAQNVFESCVSSLTEEATAASGHLFAQGVQESWVGFFRWKKSTF